MIKGEGQKCPVGQRSVLGYVPLRRAEATLSFLGQENPGVNVAALSEIFAKNTGEARGK